MPTSPIPTRDVSHAWRQWAIGHDHLDPIWSVLAESPALTVVVGLEHALRPVAAPVGYDAFDRGAVKLLDSLVQSGAELVIVTARARTIVQPLVGVVANARWVADAGLWRYDGGWTCAEEPLDVWIRKRVPGGPLLAIGDGLPLERFTPVGALELGFTVGSIDPDGLRRRMAGTTSVRAFLWWLIEVRIEHALALAREREV